MGAEFEVRVGVEVEYCEWADTEDEIAVNKLPLYTLLELQQQTRVGATWRGVGFLKGSRLDVKLFGKPATLTPPSLDPHCDQDCRQGKNMQWSLFSDLSISNHYEHAARFHMRSRIRMRMRSRLRP